MKPTRLRASRFGAQARRIALAVLLVAIPQVVFAQSKARSSLGAGFRVSFVRGDVQVDSSAARFSGGLIRARVSDKTALEVSLDHRSRTNQLRTERLRDYPVQGSILMYLVQGGFSPYLLGGAGWYSQRVETLDGQTVVKRTTTRTIGYHGGLGGEVRVGARTAIHADYRYTFIHIGDRPGGTTGSPGAIPIPGTTSLQERLKLSHQGSMWTTGVTVYF